MIAMPSTVEEARKVYAQMMRHVHGGAKKVAVKKTASKKPTKVVCKDGKCKPVKKPAVKDSVCVRCEGVGCDCGAKKIRVPNGKKPAAKKPAAKAAKKAAKKPVSKAIKKEKGARKHRKFYYLDDSDASVSSSTDSDDDSLCSCSDCESCSDSFSDSSSYSSSDSESD